MTETPRIVHRRLRAAMAGQGSDGPHPDANALNAFAEQALSLTERQHVLAHLVICKICRDVLLTALPEIVVPEPVVAAETQAMPVQAVRAAPRKALLWPTLRWGMLAAGVVTAMLLARPGFEHLTNIGRNRATSAVRQPSVVDLRSQTTAGEGGVRTGETKSKSEALASDELTKNQANGNRNPGLGTTTTRKNVAINGQKQVSEPAAVIAENRGFSASRPFPTRKEPTAIVRAKPALGTQSQRQQVLPPGESQAQAGEAPASPAALEQSPQWEIEAGSLNRSLDGGLSWQTVLQPANPLLCYAIRGGQMWVGGRAGTLLHSTDGGAHWNAMTVSVEGQAIKSDIENISVQDPAAITLTTADDEQLVSQDGGRTWQQR